LSTSKPWSKQARGWIYFAWSGSELWTLIKYSSSKIKNTNRGWFPFQGLSNGTTLMQIQSGRMVHLKISKCVQKRTTFFCVQTVLQMTLLHL
jgi:hypothetical protein